MPINMQDKTKWYLAWFDVMTTGRINPLARFLSEWSVESQGGSSVGQFSG